MDCVHLFVFTPAAVPSHDWRAEVALEEAQRSWWRRSKAALIGQLVEEIVECRAAGTILRCALLTRFLAAFASNDAPGDYHFNLRNNREDCPEHIATSEKMEIDDVCCVRNR